MDYVEKRNYIFGFLFENSNMGDSGEYLIEFKVKGRIICREVWLLIYSINKEWFRRYFNRFKEGVVVVEYGNKG